MPPADVSLASLRKLAQQRLVLQQKEQKIADTQRRLLSEVGRLLSRFGYTLVAVNGGGAERTPARGRRRTVPKQRLKCAECDRPFAYPMHLARHMSAVHGAAKRARAKAVKNSR
jgi:hypothetical protein